MIPRRILVAEDDPVNQMVVRSLLEPQGHQLTIVTNGRDALAAWEQESFDVILMDVQMPVLDGLEATAELRRRENQSGRKRTPVIGVSAGLLNKPPGMDAFLPKPLNFESLQRVLASVAARPAALAEVLAREVLRLLQMLRDGVREQNVEAVFRASHTLAGSLGYADLPDALGTARELEALSRSGELANAAALVERLAVQVASLTEGAR